MYKIIYYNWLQIDQEVEENVTELFQLIYLDFIFN